jgi:hypothetical protein
LKVPHATICRHPHCRISKRSSAGSFCLQHLSLSLSLADGWCRPHVGHYPKKHEPGRAAGRHYWRQANCLTTNLSNPDARCYIYIESPGQYFFSGGIWCVSSRKTAAKYVFATHHNNVRLLNSGVSWKRFTSISNQKTKNSIAHSIASTQRLCARLGCVGE